MINIFEVNETNKMIEQENLDVRTITLGISLLDCIDSDLQEKIWYRQEKIFPENMEFQSLTNEFPLLPWLWWVVLPVKLRRIL